MKLIKSNHNPWYKICLVLLVSLSLIACSDESSSNNDDSSEDTTNETIENDTDNRNRVVQTPSGAVVIEPGTDGPNSVEVTVPDGRTFTNPCDGGPCKYCY